MINVSVRDSTYDLDGLLYHESDLRIEEHYTDTAGFTDHVFGLIHRLGFRFAPRIRDLKDTRIYGPSHHELYTALRAMIGGKLNVKHSAGTGEPAATAVSPAHCESRATPSEALLRSKYRPNLAYDQSNGGGGACR